MAKKLFRELLAAACVITLVGGLGSAANANAAAGDAPWVDGSQTGSINIYKMKDGAEAAKNKQHKDLTPADVTTENAVAGAGFTVTPVTKVKVGADKKEFDLKKFEGWKDISKVVTQLNKTPEATTLYELGTPKPEQKTGTDGKASFTDLPIGLYKVVETTVPAGYAGTTTFFMTIPQVTGDNSANAVYNYNVNVFPKNTDVASGALGKSIDENTFVGAGDTAVYTITAAAKTIAPKPDSGWTKADFKDFAVFDDAQTNAYAAISADAVTEVKVGATVLTKGDDYTVSVIAAEEANDKFSKGLAADRQRIIVKFTDAGLDKIASAKNNDDGVQVSMNVALTLKDSANLPDKVTNLAGYVPGYNPNIPGVTPPDPVTPPTPGPGPGVVETKLGKFQIKKIAAEDNAKGLEGAKFLAFATKADADACAADKARPADKCANKASKIALESKNGGLTVSEKVKLDTNFYLVEVTAPTGYVLSPDVTPVKADKTDTVNTVSIENVLKSDSGSWFDLPKTGAIGVGIFALLGAGLVAGGTAMHMRSRRREDA
ncbi:SpaH/EbpB family LPXTG-anchored major pilin [Varibaculum vaginae]|uniref:SpaH/EbpB family LPXTG-anchored major pilin n=1 Tax=Varibaculum vaginae TaxID=2364797 RepID=UPI000F099DF2|nr:SpaH/EbpB family LPXTG-anchored major pilin [Varibaculum vaginae]